MIAGMIIINIKGTSNNTKSKPNEEDLDFYNNYYVGVSRGNLKRGPLTFLTVDIRYSYIINKNNSYLDARTNNTY